MTVEPNWPELYEERAAIMQFDGGLSVRDAEARAREYVQQLRKE